MDYFIFGDFDSRNYNMFIHETGRVRVRHLAPPKVNVTDRPIGTSGEILFDQYYAPKDIPLDIFMKSAVDNTTLQEIGSFLGNLGQKELVLSYEPYKYHNCTFDGQLSTEEFSQGLILNQIGFRALSPFGFSRFTTSDINDGIYYDDGFYYDSGIKYVEDMGAYAFTGMTNNQQFSIYHGGNCNYAFPVFQFTGAATTLKIEQYSDSTYATKINEFSYGAFSGALNVDCNLKNVFKNGVMSNNTFEGKFANLNGITSPQFMNRGTISAVSGTSVTLGDFASSVNDFYNGMSLYTLDSKLCVMEKRTITDYVGSTKVATIDSAFTNPYVGSDYAVYNLKDGMNYFKISGTGFSSLNLLVNFRYVYL